MMHAFVDIGDKTMCSRCGNEVLRVDEVCPAISDGAMYQRNHLTDEEIQMFDEALIASTKHLYDLKT